ncbi:MAG: hypothetical protein HY701_13625 [Gemmatimonadetes bacterium]|nr:hypothetical protein [Gemmatimonadota bacterium]
MIKVRRIELALWAVTIIFAVATAGTLFWRPAIPRVEIPPAGLDTPPAPGAPRVVMDAAAVQAIVDANIFSSSRAAPAVRYSPLEPDPGTGAAMMPDPALTETTGGTDDEAVPHLYGTVIGPRGATALMRLDPAIPGAQIYREGDRGGIYRVVRINEQSVILSGPGGRIVLSLIPPGGPTP